MRLVGLGHIGRYLICALNFIATYSKKFISEILVGLYVYFIYFLANVQVYEILRDLLFGMTQNIWIAFTSTVTKFCVMLV